MRINSLIDSCRTRVRQVCALPWRRRLSRCLEIPPHSSKGEFFEAECLAIRAMLHSPAAGGRSRKTSDPQVCDATKRAQRRTHRITPDSLFALYVGDSLRYALLDLLSVTHSFLKCGEQIVRQFPSKLQACIFLSLQ